MSEDGSKPDIPAAVRLLQAGELVAFPTETVYGLGADADDAAAVAKIFAAKKRPAHHPLIVHVASGAALDAWARAVPQAAYELAEAFWPGPMTLILKRGPRVIDAVTGGQDTVGLRVPNHPIALDLLARFEGERHKGIAAPSANRHGRISPTTAAHVKAELGDAVALVLDGGACDIGIESTIVDLTGATPRVLRPGAISLEDVGRVLGGAPKKSDAMARKSTPRVSGSLPSHYAPAAPLRLLARGDMLRLMRTALRAGKKIGVLARFEAPLAARGLMWRSAPMEAQGYAQQLYAALRALDDAGMDLILVEMPPPDAAWAAIADRLQRAARGSEPPEAP